MTADAELKAALGRLRKAPIETVVVGSQARNYPYHYIEIPPEDRDLLLAALDRPPLSAEARERAREIMQRHLDGLWSVRQTTDAIATALTEQERPHPDTLERETGWLIESGAGTYWTGKTPDANSFSRDPNEAVRFARRDDAERVQFWLLDKKICALLRASEHIWLEGRLHQ